MNGHNTVKQVPRRGFSLHPLHAALLMAGLAGGTAAQAKDYFDPAFLGAGADAVDLSAYETAGITPEGNYLVDIFMNQDKQSTRQVRFEKDKKGNVNPALTPAMLKEMGVALDRLPAFKGLAPDAPVGDLKALIPGATVNFSMSTLRLDITVPQVDMDARVAGDVDPKLWDEGVPAMLFSYNLTGSRNRMEGQNGMGGNTSQSAFGSVNGGANLGPWRLRSSLTMSHNESDGNGYRYSANRSQFGNTYLQRDVQFLRGEMTAGESSSGGDIFDSIPFRGVRLVSSDDMLPSSQRGFAPVITGTAKSNARVTVTQNGSVIYETSVPPGPFRLTDIYSAGNGGELVVTVTEADGSKHVSTQTFSTLPVMKRPGGLDYEVTAGRYKNGGYTRESRDPLFALATVTVGLPHYITLYGGLLGAEGYQSLAAGIGVSLGLLGAVSVDSTVAHTSPKDSDIQGTGASFRARYSKSMMATGTTVDLTAYRYSTSHYYSFQDAMGQGYGLRDGYAPWLAERRRSSWQISLSQTLGRIGSLFLRAARDDYWGSGRVVNSMSAGFSSSVKGVGYSVNYDVDHTSSLGRNAGSGDWPTNRQVSLNVSVPFSIFNPSSSVVQDINANYSMTHDNHGRTSQQAGLSGSLLDNRLSWSASQSADNQGGGRSGNLNLGYSGDRGNVGVGYGYADHSQSVNMNASGGVVIHPHGVSLTRSLGDSMALVEAPGADGVQTMNGGGTTDSRGYAVVPYLQNYQRNTISLDTTTLPDGVDVNDSSVTVYPTKGALVEAKFKTRVGRQAMLTLNFRGKPVPFGALASLPGDDVQSAAIVGDGGVVYLTGAPQAGVLSVQWGSEPDKQCRVHYDLGALPAKKAGDTTAVSITQQTLTCDPLPGVPVVDTTATQGAPAQPDAPATPGGTDAPVTPTVPARSLPVPAAAPASQTGK